MFGCFGTSRGNGKILMQNYSLFLEEVPQQQSLGSRRVSRLLQNLELPASTFVFLSFFSTSPGNGKSFVKHVAHFLRKGSKHTGTQNCVNLWVSSSRESRIFAVCLKNFCGHPKTANSGAEQIQIVNRITCSHCTTAFWTSLVSNS